MARNYPLTHGPGLIFATRTPYLDPLTLIGKSRKQNPNQIIEYLVIEFSRIFGNIAERHLQPRLCTFDKPDI